jgi:cytidylate kinase
MIITISREFGSGGSEVARRVAERLGYTLVDNQLIEEVARRAGLPPDVVAEREERVPGFAERITRTLASAMPEFVVPEGGTIPALDEEQLVRLTEAVVSQFAAGGRVVMVGRAAPAVLGRREDALHVKIVAPVADRVARVAERQGITPREAERLVRDSDQHRARYHRQYYNRDWHDPVNYHLVLNTGWLGANGAAELIVVAASRYRPPSG